LSVLSATDFSEGLNGEAPAPQSRSDAGAFSLAFERLPHAGAAAGSESAGGAGEGGGVSPAPERAPPLPTLALCPETRLARAWMDEVRRPALPVGMAAAARSRCCATTVSSSTQWSVTRQQHNATCRTSSIEHRASNIEGNARRRQVPRMEAAPEDADRLVYSLDDELLLAFEPASVRPPFCL